MAARLSRVPLDMKSAGDKQSFFNGSSHGKSLGNWHSSNLDYAPGRLGVFQVAARVFPTPLPLSHPVNNASWRANEPPRG
jgi:hypothetical protein